MSNEEIIYENNGSEDNKLLIPAILGIGIGAAILLTKKKSDGGGPGTIILSAAYKCLEDNRSQVILTWVSTTEDIDFDVLRSGTTVATVRGSSYKSNIIPVALQNGQVDSWRVIGVPSGVKSGLRYTFNLPCPLDDQNQPTISAITVTFS